jgi:WD40 repeat protein
MDGMMEPLPDTVIKEIKCWDIGRNHGNDSDSNGASRLLKRWLKGISKFEKGYGKLLVPLYITFRMSPAIIWHLYKGLATLGEVNELTTPLMLLGELLPEAHEVYENALSRGGSLHTRFGIATEFSGKSLLTTARTSDVMLKQVQMKVGTAGAWTWLKDGSSQPQGPQQLLSLLSRFSKDYGELGGRFIELLNDSSKPLSDTLKTLTTLGLSLHEAGQLDRVLTKLDYQRGILSEQESFVQFMKLLSSVDHGKIVIRHSSHLSNQHLLTLCQRSKNLRVLHLVDCPSITILPIANLKGLERLILKGMSQLDTIDVSGCESLVELVLMVDNERGLPNSDKRSNSSQLRSVVLNYGCRRLYLGFGTWHTELQTIQLGRARYLEWENVYGVPEAGELWIDEVVRCIVTGQYEGLSRLPSTRDIERVLEKLDWSSIPEGRREEWIDEISKYALHRLSCAGAAWLTFNQSKMLLAAHSTIFELRLARCGLTHDPLMTIVQGKRQLQSLSVRDNPDLDVNIYDLSNVCPNLEKLDLSGTGQTEFVSKREIRGLFGTNRVQYMSKLEWLDLSRCSSLRKVVLVENLTSVHLAGSGIQELPYCEGGFPQIKDIAECSDLMQQQYTIRYEVGGQLIRSLCSDSLQSSRILTGHSGWVESLIELSDGRIVSGSGDNTLRVWDLTADVGKECVRTLTGHSDMVTSVIELSDGRIVSGSVDETLRVWDLTADEGKECVRTLTGHSSSVYSVIELSDGRIVSGSGDSTLRVWDLIADVGKECVRKLTGHSGSVRSVIELSDGRIVSGSYDSTLRVWSSGYASPFLAKDPYPADIRRYNLRWLIQTRRLKSRHMKQLISTDEEELDFSNTRLRWNQLKEILTYCPRLKRLIIRNCHGLKRAYERGEIVVPVGCEMVV